MNIFLNKERKIRNLWWAAIFFIVLAAFTFPLILLSSKYQFEITLIHQAVIIMIASGLCQLIKGEPFFKFIGKPDLYFLKKFLIGALIGALLMLLPAMLLYIGGWVHWDVFHVGYTELAVAALMIFVGALAEEFLFRGFVFQRILSGLGAWPAQLIMSGLFLLTHLNNPGMTGTVKLLASLNIFIASLLFGLAYIRTKSLAMPIGLHFMANLVQGTILGFGVSGENGISLFTPEMNLQPAWITGGSFGLEASIFGLLVLIGVTILFYRRMPIKR